MNFLLIFYYGNNKKILKINFLNLYDLKSEKSENLIKNKSIS